VSLPAIDGRATRRGGARSSAWRGSARFGDRHAEVLSAGDEKEVVALIGRGLTNRQIRGRAQLSERTVENDVRHIPVADVTERW
jgi:DNA-binding NarL/FixJ family response regulator